MILKRELLCFMAITPLAGIIAYVRSGNRVPESIVSIVRRMIDSNMSSVGFQAYNDAERSDMMQFRRGHLLHDTLALISPEYEPGVMPHRDIDSSVSVTVKDRIQKIRISYTAAHDSFPGAAADSLNFRLL